MSVPLVGKYKGDMVNGLFEGKGTYEYPDDKGKYVGHFKNGVYHGEGILFVHGGSFQGTWANGHLVNGGFVFEDGLKYKQGDESWSYCSSQDRRFWTEVQASVPLGGPLKYPTPNPHDYESVPPGCYDCIDGYYNPKRPSLYEYHTGEEKRSLDKEERDWIAEHCRVKEFYKEE